MSRIFITGSSDGLGLAAGQLFIQQGHDVVLHARNTVRAAETRKMAGRAEAVVTGDLSRFDETRSVAEQVNALGRFDAVIHNAGVGYREPHRLETVDGHAHVLAINVLAPYILTALITRPSRLIYLSSGMHQGGVASTRDLDWADRSWNGSQAYSDSKLFDTTLAFWVAKHWTNVLSNALEPGWVPTKMGGRGAPDDLAQAHLTQVWLATSIDTGAMVSGRYFFHKRFRTPNPASGEAEFQDDLIKTLSNMTGVSMPVR